MPPLAKFQCSSASRKFLNFSVAFSEHVRFLKVSVLFSEPKIPQFFCGCGSLRCSTNRFSALQRAENSSIGIGGAEDAGRPRFQCSSASRKFLNHSSAQQHTADAAVSVLFSEPKIPQYAAPSAANRAVRVFQCSSASRKFLNQVYPGAPAALERRFSALQRAENSSIGTAQTIPGAAREFQCSSASRKFLNPDPRTCVHPYFRPR